MPKPKVKKQYICAICGKSLSRSDHFNNHMRGHEGIKRYKCTTCGKKFADKTNLDRHQRIHTGEQPYRCRYCGWRFRQPGNLSRHIRLHEGIKPHQCSICGKCFSRKRDLINHQEGASNCRPDSTPASSPIKTTVQPLDNGKVAVCTSYKVTISHGLVLRFSRITGPEGSATVTTQQHRGALVTTVEQEESNASAANVIPEPEGPEIDPMLPQFDDPIDDSPTTSVFYTGDLDMGDIDFDPEDSLPEIPGMPEV